MPLLTLLADREGNNRCGHVAYFLITIVFVCCRWVIGSGVVLDLWKPGGFGDVNAEIQDRWLVCVIPLGGMYHEMIVSNYRFRPQVIHRHRYTVGCKFGYSTQKRRLSGPNVPAM
jgi:hypothetical protein